MSLDRQARLCTRGRRMRPSCPREGRNQLAGATHVGRLSPSPDRVLGVVEVSDATRVNGARSPVVECCTTRHLCDKGTHIRMHSALARTGKYERLNLGIAARIARSTPPAFTSLLSGFLNLYLRTSLASRARTSTSHHRLARSAPADVFSLLNNKCVCVCEPLID